MDFKCDELILGKKDADSRALTLRLQDALALVDIRILDHLVVGTEGVVSLAERGLI